MTGTFDAGQFIVPGKPLGEAMAEMTKAGNRLLCLKAGLLFEATRTGNMMAAAVLADEITHINSELVSAAKVIGEHADDCHRDHGACANSRRSLFPDTVPAEWLSEN